MTIRNQHRPLPATPSRGHPPLAWLALAIGLATHAGAQHSTEDPITVRLEPVASGLVGTIGGTDQIFPTELIPFPDGSGRLLVGTLGGVLRLIDAAGTLSTTPYHDTTSALTINAENGNASFGLTCAAFHPDFAVPGAPGFGRFYTVEPEVIRADPPPDFPGIGTDQGGSNPAHDRVLYEYTADDPTADVFAGAKREVLRIHEHRRGHDLGDLAFDNAGYLLISSGDTVVPASAQDPLNVFGSILRIDPLAPATTPGSPDPVSANGRYRVPADNPFLGDPNALDEIFAYGLRNPYRISVDPLDGQLYVTSNGDSSRESAYAVTSGDNLGWPVFEGTLERQTPPAGFIFWPPVFEYDHSLGVSINGAFVYRGGELPALAGRLVFADFLGAGGSGPRLFYGDLASGVFFDLVADASGAPMPGTIVSLGEDAERELYLVSTDGSIARLAAPGSPPDNPPPTSPPSLVEDFEALGPGAEPPAWRDTGAGNSLLEDPALFQTAQVGPTVAFGTASTQVNIHSHYDTEEARTWTGYRYRGRLYMSDADGGLGVTAFSQYRQGGTDAYYRLRRFAGEPSFRLAPHGTTVQGAIDSGVVPGPNTWYRFLLELEDTGVRTEVRAKVWPDGTPEPVAFQVDAFDGGAARLRSGTVGFWTLGPGEKYLDDVRVESLAPIFTEGFESGNTSEWARTVP